MTVDRRTLLAGLGGVTGAAAVAASTQSVQARSHFGVDHAETVKLTEGAKDQTRLVQAAIDRAAKSGAAVVLPVGDIPVTTLHVRTGTRLIGSETATRLVGLAQAPVIAGERSDHLVLERLAILGQGQAVAGISLSACDQLTIADLSVSGVRGRGIDLSQSSGRVAFCDISGCGDAGIFSLDAHGLTISDNAIADCGNNGIQVWRSVAGEDGSIISRNRISHIGAASGGNGQNGNGVNVFRADGVVVEANRISDCAYSAVRGNAASNIQILANSCVRLGEVALYAEFGFEGAIISSNLVDTAATGISVTNFADGGRLAVINGNLLRNLFRREHEPHDKRGEGIFVEADAAVSGNTIENAASFGLMIGWGPHMRNVAATGNVIRVSRVGIAVTAAKSAGGCLIANNLISGTRAGAVRAVNHGSVVGADLAGETTTTGRVTISANLAV